jgi:hypothetical protein
MGYKLKSKWRGFKAAAGFHKRYLQKVYRKLEENKVSYVIFKQTGKYLYNTMERAPQLRVEIKN